MGNIFEKVSANKSAVLSSVTALSFICYLLYEFQEKKKFRQHLLQALKNSKQINQEDMNHVYLKDLVDHHEIRNVAENPIYKVVITGGPCAGKTTSMQRIKKLFNEKGYRVLCVPEVPTMVVLAGGMILMSRFNSQERVKFQSLLIRFQMYAEDYFTRLAQMSHQPSIVLCDRGTVDPYAYIPKEQFQAVLDAEGWSWVTLRDRRYDRVCFLSSAANGAEEFYTLENNVARSEGVELARELDRKTLQAWTGHPHLTVVPNVKGESFEQKIERAVVAVQKTVGEEIFNVIYNKYLVRKPQFPEGMKVQVSDIEETYLVNNDPKYDEDKLKKRGSNNSFTYQRKYRCVKDDDNYSQQIRKPLTSLQYVTLKEQKADMDFETVFRQRLNFVYNNLSYSVDVYNNILGEQHVYLLRFNTKKGEAEAHIPPFIEPIRDVKGMKEYNLREIARRNK